MKRPGIMATSIALAIGFATAAWAAEGAGSGTSGGTSGVGNMDSGNGPELNSSQLNTRAEFSIRDRMRLYCQTAPLVLTSGLNVLLLRAQVVLLPLQRFAEDLKRTPVRNACGLVTSGSRAINAATV